MLRGSPAWKHTITQDIQAPWESSMETHIHTRGGYRPTPYKPCGSPALTQEDIQALWESSMETYNHTEYTSSLGVQHGNTHSHKRIYRLCGREYKHKMIGQNIAQYGMR